jgi:hypothetical protein
MIAGFFHRNTHSKLSPEIGLPGSALGVLYLYDYQYYRKVVVPTPLKKPEVWNLSIRK